MPWSTEKACEKVGGMSSRGWSILGKGNRMFRERNRQKEMDLADKKRD